MELLKKLQNELKVPKNLHNSFGNYNYRNAETILEEVKKLLNGEATIVCSDEVVCVGDRNYVKATAILSDGKEEVFVTAFAREPESRKGMDESQITGATSSYARKYALNGLFAIDDVRDADHDDNRHIEAKPPKTAPKNDYPPDDRPWLSEKQLEQVIARLEAGEPILDDTFKAFRMKREYREKLNEYQPF